MPTPKKIAIVHYRAGRTDGVSLEIDKRVRILRDLGHSVRVVSGPVSNGSDCVIDDLEFDSPEVVEVKKNCFSYFGPQSCTTEALMERIGLLARRIELAFLSYHDSEGFDALLVHNIFSHGRHIAAASAFERVARALSVPVVATHHDYYWERPEYTGVTNRDVRRYLDTFVPPQLPKLTHVSINSISRDELLRRRGIDSVVLPDVWDFDQPQWSADDYNSDFLGRIDATPEDLIVLQATRIVARKGIEIAIDFVKELGSRLGSLIGKRLYNGKVLGQKARVILVLAGYAEESAISYLRQLEAEARLAGIEVRFVSGLIDASRVAGREKVYSLWDAYVYSDVVTYPSQVEGWGNQFIEAVFARRPVVLFEYPVFKADIQREGYVYVSLGDVALPRDGGGLVRVPAKAIRLAADELCSMLVAPVTCHVLEENARIGGRYHGFHVMRDFLSDAVDGAFCVDDTNGRISE